MRKIVFYLLFLIYIALNLFLGIPCQAENFPKNREVIILAQVAPPYYSIPAQSYMPAEYKDIDLNDKEKFPEASENYQPEIYWY